MYEFYFDKVLLPVTPDKLTMKIGGADKTYTLMNEGEISVLKSPKLTDIEFDLLLPNNQYPFAVYPTSKFVPAVYYLDLIKGYKQDKTPFQFKITRVFPNGKAIFDTDMKVSLDSYTIKESADNGFDVVVSIKLKQYRDYGTKTCDVKLDTEKPKASVKKDRPVTSNAPTTAGKEKVITVKKGDTLWGICKTHLGNGALYPQVAKENGISNPNLLQIGQKIKLTASVTSGKASKNVVKDKTSGGSKNKPPFAILTSSYGVVRTNIKTWNEAYGYYNANGGSGKGWKITDSDKDVITL
jgi:LysM repeat protein